MLKSKSLNYFIVLSIYLTPLFASQISILNLEGHVYLKSDVNKVNILKTKKVLELPQTFNTGPGSIVTVQIDSVTSLEVGESSKIKFEKLSSGEFFIDLSIGSVKVNGVQLDSSLKPTLLSVSTSTLSSDIQCFECGIETNGFNTLAWNFSGKMKIKHIFYDIERSLMQTEAAIQKPNAFEEYDYIDSTNLASALIGLKKRYLRLDYVSLNDSLVKIKRNYIKQALSTLPKSRNEQQKILIQELKFRTLSNEVK